VAASCSFRWMVRTGRLTVVLDQRMDAISDDVAMSYQHWRLLSAPPLSDRAKTADVLSEAVS